MYKRTPSGRITRENSRALFCELYHIRHKLAANTPMATMASVATRAATYVWEDPGDSIMIQVTLDLVEKLGALVQQGLGTGPRGVEIGGILLGRTLPGFGRSILIEDFEPTPCEHLREIGRAHV